MVLPENPEFRYRLPERWLESMPPSTPVPSAPGTIRLPLAALDTLTQRLLGLQRAECAYDQQDLADASVEYSRGSATASAVFHSVNNNPVQMSLYEWPRGKAKLSVDFQYMLSRAPDEWLKQLLERLLSQPVVGSKLRDVEAAGFKKRPGIPVEELLSHPTAEKALLDKIGEIVAVPSGSDQA